MNKQTIQFAAVLIITALLLTGCGGRENVLLKDLQQLKQENTDLSSQVQSLQQENTRLSEQVDTLAGLDESVRLKDLDTLAQIRLGRRTGLYDMDENGTDETLMVYVETLDAAQDYVKAVGTVRVQLWDLNTDPAGAKLADWTLKPNEIKDRWGGNIFAGYYRIPFEAANILSTHRDELTVKVTFTDLLSGRVLRDQTVITP